MMSPELEALRRWREGDPQAFDLVYAEAAPALATFCRLLARDEAAAADLFQETWKQAVAKIAGYRGERPLRSWLATIAHHLWVDQKRRHAIEQRALEARGRQQLGQLPSQAGEALILREALDLLSSEEREAVLLYDLQRLTIRETARLLGVSPSSVQERLARARRTLAKAFKIE